MSTSRHNQLIYKIKAIYLHSKNKTVRTYFLNQSKTKLSTKELQYKILLLSTIRKLNPISIPLDSKKEGQSHKKLHWHFFGCRSIYLKKTNTIQSKKQF